MSLSLYDMSPRERDYMQSRCVREAANLDAMLVKRSDSRKVVRCGFRLAL